MNDKILEAAKRLGALIILQNDGAKEIGELLGMSRDDLADLVGEGITFAGPDFTKDAITGDDAARARLFDKALGAVVLFALEAKPEYARQVARLLRAIGAFVALNSPDTGVAAPNMRKLLTERHWNKEHLMPLRRIFIEDWPEDASGNTKCLRVDDEIIGGINKNTLTSL